MTNNPATDLIISPPPELLPALFVPTPKAQKRFVQFFTTQISNDNTRRAYVNATRRFAEWCERHQLRELVDVEPFHVAAWLKDMQQDGLQKPTIKQHLAAVRMLFDWLVTGHVIEMNPAHAVSRAEACREERQDACVGSR